MSTPHYEPNPQSDPQPRTPPTDPLGPSNPNFPLDKATEEAAKAKCAHDEYALDSETEPVMPPIPPDIPSTEPERKFFDAADAGVEADDVPVVAVEDDFPTEDAKLGAALGAGGGAITGAIAGSVVGPAGTVAGAVIGGLVGGVASGAAVQAVDAVDNDGSANELPDVDEVVVTDPDANTAVYRKVDDRDEDD